MQGMASHRRAMPSFVRRSRRAAALLGTALVTLLSCGREVTGPGLAGRSADLQFVPVFPEYRQAGNGQPLSIGDVVDFARVRIVLLRTNGDTVVDRLVDFPPDSASVRLVVSVTLSQAATPEGEPFTATLKYIDSAGDTVFSGGPVSVIAKPAGSSNPPPPPQIPVTYVGPGNDAADISITPTSVDQAVTGQTLTFTATVRDSTDATMTGVPVAFTSSDTTVVRVNLRTGAAQFVGVRGQTYVLAQTLTGQVDSAFVRIPPVPTQIALFTGGGQQVRQGSAFPLPVRVRVVAADNQGVANTTVDFSVLSGQGSVLPTSAVTDAGGLAQTTWTAGDSAGAASIRAQVNGTALAVTINGTQLSSAPSSLFFLNQPGNITAGDSLAPIIVVVRDATGDTVRNFTGNVTLDLQGGTAGAALYGVTTRAAVNGVATFPFLTVDRGGTAYRLRATLAGVPQALSNTFNAANAPARFVTIIQGANQTAPASTALTDSIKARVTDAFGFAVPGVTVNFAMSLGGGTLSPTTGVTNASGIAATRWTLGAAGSQQILVSAPPLNAVAVNATIFVPGGTPALFVGVQFASTAIAQTRAIPVFIEPAPASPIVATLTMRDTLIARWTAPSVTFSAGANLRNPTVVGVDTGTTWAIVSSSAGTDSLEIHVETAQLVISGSTYQYVNLGDTLRRMVILTAPAPAGGVTVTIASTDTALALVARGTGRGAPEEDCDLYFCSDLRATDGPAVIGTPADSAFVTIPEGQTIGQFVVILHGLGDANIHVTAPNFAPDDAALTVEQPYLYLYSYWGGVPLGAGYHAQFEVDLSRSSPRDIPISLTIRDTSIATTDTLVVAPKFNSYTYDHRLRLKAPGTTYLVAEAPNHAPDSLAITVVQPWLRFADRFPSRTVGTRDVMQVNVAADANGSWQGYWYADGEIRLSVTSSDTSVMKAEFGGVIHDDDASGYAFVYAASPGTAWLRVSAPGHVTDSVLVTVTGNTINAYDSNHRVGTGQLHNTFIVQQGAYSGSSAGKLLRVEVTSSDTSIAAVLTPDLIGTVGGSLPNPQIVGRALGTVQLTFAGTDVDTVVQTLTVAPPQLLLAGSIANGGIYNADSSSIQVLTYTTDDQGTSRPTADTLRAILRSTNPSVIAVLDSNILFTPGSGLSYGGLIRLITPGTAQLFVVAPGYQPDTSNVFTLRPYRVDIAQASVTLGARLSQQVSFTRRSPPSAVLAYTTTVSGPAAVTVEQPTGQWNAGLSGATIRLLAGATVGVDTVIVSAAGLAPDTLIVNVSAARLVATSVNSQLVGTDAQVSARLRSTLVGTFQAIQDTATVRIEIADTAVAEIISDAIHFSLASGTFPDLTATIRYRRPGTTWLRLIDPQGRFLPDSLQITGRRQAFYVSPNRLAMGVSTETQFGELYVYRETASNDSVWVKLTSSAPTVAQVTADSVLMLPGDYYAYFDVVAGDSVGGAIINVSATGYVDTQVQVGVMTNALDGYAYDDLLVGHSEGIDVYLRTSRSYETRTTRVPVPVRMRSLSPGVLAIGADSTFTIPIGSSYAYLVGPIIGVSPGRADFVIEDQRPYSIQQALPVTTSASVRSPRLMFGEGPATVAVGFMQPNGGYVSTNGYYYEDVWVRLTSVRGRVGFDQDSINLSGYYSGSFSMRGLSAGIDTIVATAPGYSPDTMLVQVGEALFDLSSTPLRSVGSGDSVLVSLTFRIPSGSSAWVDVASLPISVSTSGPVQVTQPGGTGPASVINVGQGSYGFSFWVKGTGVGVGEITFSGPGLQPYRLRVPTVP